MSFPFVGGLLARDPAIDLERQPALAIAREVHHATVQALDIRGFGYQGELAGAEVDDLHVLMTGRRRRARPHAAPKCRRLGDIGEPELLAQRAGERMTFCGGVRHLGSERLSRRAVDLIEAESV